MRCTLKNINTWIRIKGDAGNENGSEAILEIPGIGKIQLDEQWDLHFLEGATISSLTLRIPSGELKLQKGGFQPPAQIKKETIEGYSPRLSMIFPKGTWKGKANGLLGGMSGFFGFKVSQDQMNVHEGAFILPKDHHVVFDTSEKPVDFSDTHLSFTVSGNRYLERKALFRVWEEKAILDGQVSPEENLPKKAKKIAGVPLSSRTEEQNHYIEWWWALITSIDESIEKGTSEAWRLQTQIENDFLRAKKYRLEKVRRMRDILNKRETLAPLHVKNLSDHIFQIEQEEESLLPEEEEIFPDMKGYLSQFPSGLRGHTPDFLVEDNEEVEEDEEDEDDWNSDLSVSDYD